MRSACVSHCLVPDLYTLVEQKKTLRYQRASGSRGLRRSLPIPFSPQAFVDGAILATEFGRVGDLAVFGELVVAFPERFAAAGPRAGVVRRLHRSPPAA